MNIVPTDFTKQVAEALLRDARATSVEDAVIKHCAAIQLAPDQFHALLAYAIRRAMGADVESLPRHFGDHERYRLHLAFKAGDRSPRTLMGEIEYSRLKRPSTRGAK